MQAPFKVCGNHELSIGSDNGLICTGKLRTGSDNGLSPVQRQAIIWTNSELLSIGPLGRNFSEICIEIQTFSSKKYVFKNVICKMAAILS